MNRRVPFARHRFEAVDHDFRPAGLLGFADSTGIDPLGEQATRLVAPFPDSLQTCVGVVPSGNLGLPPKLYFSLQT